MEKYKCGICETSYNDLEDYLLCVARCGEKEKKRIEEEKNKKYLEKLNKDLNAVKSAKTYYEEQLNKFKEKYPKEYEVNFAHTCSGDCKCHETETSKTEKSDKKKPKVKEETFEFSYNNNGKDAPKMSAKVNGKKVDDDALQKLFADPETNYLARVLGIL